jgi:hypothetical protein
MQLDREHYVCDCIGSQEYCPVCKEHLVGEDIYQHFLDRGYTEEEAYQTAKMYGWSSDKPISFRKEIAIEIPEVYDGAIYYACPVCKSYWRRFSMEVYEQIKEDDDYDQWQYKIND